jgi:hypothetical protein
MSQYTAGLPINVSSGSAADQLLPPIDPKTIEDCLFLDVMVPEEIFETAEDGSGAPLLGQWPILSNLDVNGVHSLAVHFPMNLNSLDSWRRIHRW